ncbi:membrane protein YdbS with pleckstrin-like domain [Nocardiopsis mwathae]|uniref:Membrane protein YdbS with pleckstrin-like domain n=1 Tax=Nocardiopsis mwathae TaxID=1472723 RepID=A0A7W9YMD0_9ACTN|nr:hypothetical protein [Nocardiopsis mwathae]MBB6174804.1 membrane protein YdbS with pleckstrin-like domain [Nocardiopsis mwathae]
MTPGQRNFSDAALSIAMVLILSAAAGRFLEDGMNVHFWWWVVATGAPVVLVVTVSQLILRRRPDRSPTAPRG